MGYGVSVTGRIRMSESAEATAVEALRRALWRGEYIDGGVGSLADLAQNSVITREGEWLQFDPDDADPK